MDLRDHLQSALSGSYTLDRELGGGGMSRVFVATDTALGRNVVIKILPTELTAGVNVDRFKREISLAANLQHPHIVPVLAAGELNGVPYYTMPFIDGESLRARLSRGPVPIGEVVSILRDVGRALAYAHERGVVHRDIKPDNVLLSSGSATVTDFGIAKAISASRIVAPGATLTQIGTSIGTPAYMAPEQAAADPSADHRADIYAFGCMAYELLAGQPPFHGLAPHRLLAAHMGETPKPVSSLRADTPQALADLVMAALAKEPDHRPENARDILRVLDMMSTGSGSNPALPAALFSGRGMLTRALWMYAVAFVVVMIVAKAAIVGIGLPDWVFPGALIVMSFGLPVILATAWVQRTARHTFTATPTLTPGGTTMPHGTMATIALKASPHLSWRRAATGGALALGGFVLLIGVFMLMRSYGIGPVGSLLAAGQLSDRDRILVADFTSTGADSSLGGTISEAVRSDLGQSPIISVVTPQVVASALQRMQLAATTRVDSAIARQIAQREGIKAFVDGNITSLKGGGYVLTMRLVRADSGQELASLRTSGDGIGQLIPSIGKLTHDLRDRMGEPLRHLQTTLPLDQATTASLPALKAYTEARSAMGRADYTPAIAALERAIAIDTAFASAYRALAIAIGNTNGGRERQSLYLQKAFDHADRLPEIEKYLAIGSYYFQGPKPDLAKSLDAYTALLAIDPTAYNAENNKALVYLRSMRFDKASAGFRRAIALSPDRVVSYENLIFTLSAVGAPQREVDSLVAVITALVPSDKVRLDVMFQRGEYDRLDSLAAVMAKSNPDDRITIEQLTNYRFAIAMVRGQLAKGLELESRRATMAESRDVPLSALFAALDSAKVDSWYRANGKKASALLQAALSRNPLAKAAPPDRPYGDLAFTFAMAGSSDPAARLLDEYSHNERSRFPEDVAWDRHLALGAIAYASGRYAESVREWRAVVGQNSDCFTCGLPLLGHAYDLDHQADSAIATFTRYVNSTDIGNRTLVDPWYLAGSYKRLGELWEAKGDGQKAAINYAKFVELWKNADPELRPQVIEVRRRLARLGDAEKR